MLAAHDVLAPHFFLEALPHLETKGVRMVHPRQHCRNLTDVSDVFDVVRLHLQLKSVRATAKLPALDCTKRISVETSLLATFILTHVCNERKTKACLCLSSFTR